jgi:hypothetical protein
MDYTEFNIIKILPCIYLGDINTKSYEDNLKTLNIEYIININNTLNTNTYTTYNISVDSNLEYFDSSKPIDIDLNATNEFIINAMQNNSCILICDINYVIPLLIIGSFLIKYLDITFTECIYWLSKKTNVNFLYKNICYKLFLYYEENN